MDQILDKIEQYQESYNNLVYGENPTVDNWPLMGSPVPLSIILLLYLYFVLKLGPQFMEKRKPFKLDKILILYNAYQIVFYFWLCKQAFHVKNGFRQVFSLGCKPGLVVDNEFAYALWRGAWWYFISKVVELLDTVFFVLRKKQNQVSFLHVYHHFVMCFLTWGYLKFLPGEQGVFLGFVNSVVHIFTYFYYMLAGMGPNYQKYLWWKKYITWIQLIQFTAMLVYLVGYLISGCNKLHRSLTFFFVGNVVIFLYLFINFYRKAYLLPKKEKCA